MVLPYAELMNLERSYNYHWDDRAVILYALSLGMPSDPLCERELAYVSERGLSVLPTFFAMAALIESATSYAGLDYEKILHGEQAIIMHRPAPTRGEALIKSRMVGAWDKGVGKGAVFRDQSQLFFPGEDEPFATVTNTTFGRAEGGYGAPGAEQPVPHGIPDRSPDTVSMVPTLRQQALLYRQASGDLNPLHFDPAAARAAGFREPILHGMCTFGICQRAILAEHAGFAPDRLKLFQARFAGIVYPGDTLRVETWRDGSTISFQAFAAERGVKVIANGKAELA